MIGSRQGLAGMSLLETVLGMTLTLILLAGALGLLSAQGSAQRRAARSAEAEENLRLAMAALQSELRGAGDGYPGLEIVALAEPNRITVQGAAAGALQTTTLWLDGNTLRRRRGSSTQPMIDGIDAFGLEYLDDSDPSQPVPVATAEERAAIRQIRVTLSHAQPPCSLQSTVLLRRPLP